MKPITFSLQFRGRATTIRSDRLRFNLTAPSSALVTTVGPEGVSGAFEDVPGAEAVLESELSFGGRGQTAFDEVGTIEFGRGHALRFRSMGLGRLAACPDPNLKQGAVVREVEGGSGQFAGAEGLITSNFFVSDTGEVTENHLGLIFVHDRRETPAERRKDEEGIASYHLSRPSGRRTGRASSRGETTQSQQKEAPHDPR